MANEDKQLIAGEWSDVLDDYGVDPPRHIKLIIALLVTVAVILNTYWDAISKVKLVSSMFKRKKDDNETEAVGSERTIDG
jgi:hypothetical protein